MEPMDAPELFEDEKCPRCGHPKPQERTVLSDTLLSERYEEISVQMKRLGIEDCSNFIWYVVAHYLDCHR